VLIRLSITFAGVLTTLALSVLLAAAQSSKPPQPAYPAASPAVQGQPFQDPHGKYRLSIPPGWELSMTGDEPIFRNGTSWIQVRCLTASSASAAVDQAAGLFRSQYTAFNTINRGNTTIGGHASHGLNIDATTTGGQRVSVLLTAQPEGKKQYLVLISATPVAQAPQLNTSVMALANSVRFTGE
jgi:hypothetical protein